MTSDKIINFTIYHSPFSMHLPLAIDTSVNKSQVIYGKRVMDNSWKMTKGKLILVHS